ncbi:hypothetical protein GWI72_13445 [Microvirga tunisiensis]|uniref:Uncharacterized protein n=1 Tax=Pannonibacter tanglangensis TaxID=2750084 RepID=A0A7X5J985_9HYPH|nr:hypothetical protein [Pannonibacter sp. XCT-53]NBN79277.1 hypothetical protein [Pannonibacter sp. XCT-53]
MSSTSGQGKRVSTAGRVLLAGYFLAVCLLVIGVAVLPRPGEPVAVFTTSPVLPAAEVVARAGGSLIALSPGGQVAVTPLSRAGDIDLLYRSGAFIVTAAWFAEACLALVPSVNTQLRS